MEINADLRGSKLLILTPQYGGLCYGSYAYSLLKLQARCIRFGVQVDFRFIQNESLISRARTYQTQSFMDSEYDHALFIDADIGFEPDSALTLLALQKSDPEKYSIICAPYCKKTLSTEKMVAAVNQGKCDSDPNELLNYVGDYVFNLEPGVTEVNLAEPVPILEGGTGFLMMSRLTLEKFEKAYPELKYRPDHVRTAGFDGSREITLWFHCDIDPVSKRYLSEDYWFCQKVRAAGMQVWMCPWINLTHTGTFVFGGSLAHLASIGASATADENLIKKNREKKQIT